MVASYDAITYKKLIFIIAVGSTSDLVEAILFINFTQNLPKVQDDW